MKYIRLLRIPDQYLQIGTALIAGFYFHLDKPFTLLWALSCTLLSFTIFLINEMTDRIDTDIHSWNDIHVKDKNINVYIVYSIGLLISVLGLIIAYYLNLFIWAAIYLIIGILYSVKPVRMKGVFLLDLLAQFAVWIIIPVLGPAWLMNKLDDPVIIPGLLSLCLMIIPSLYAYQLADLEADKKACLNCTHVVLGINKSLWIGLTSGILGITVFLLVGLWNIVPFAFVVPLITLYSFYKYILWFRIKSEKEFNLSLQSYVKLIKPLTRLFIFFLLVIYILQ